MKQKEFIKDEDKAFSLSKTAKMIGVSRPTLYSYIEKGFIKTSTRADKVVVKHNEILKFLNE